MKLYETTLRDPVYMELIDVGDGHWPFGWFCHNFKGALK